MNQRTLLLRALHYIAKRKCAGCSPTENAAPTPANPCSHDAARAALAEHDRVEAERAALAERYARRRR